MLYECPKCTKKFNRKSNYDTHLLKKYPCKPLLQTSIEIPLYSILNSPRLHLNPLSPTDTQNLLIMKEEIVQNNSLNEKHDIITFLSVPPLIKTKKEYKCEYCFKIMSRSDVLQKHINLYCKVKKDNENINQNIQNIQNIQTNQTNQKILTETIQEMKIEIETLHKSYAKLEKEHNNIKRKLTKREAKRNKTPI
jgi:hypothetical protein